MTAEGPSSAEGLRETSPRTSSTPISNGLSEAGPGPATEAARRARRSHSASTGTDVASATEGSDDEDEDYERQRRQRMLENQSLLAELDIFGVSIAERAPRPAPRRPAKYVERRDRYGYVVSLPPPGKTQRLAAIEVRTDRGTRRAIDAGEYADCTSWGAGEERRWRFGWGEGVLKEGEEEVVGGVGPDFRWKKLGVVDVEREREAATRAAMELGTPTPPPEPAYKKKYSELPEGTCHQCRRRSDKAKMRCRNVEAECKNLFCETCCKRYYYFEFDEEDRGFICPVCLDKCNCKSHLEDLGLGHLSGTAFKAPGDGEGLLPGETVQHYIERYIENKGREQPPFDRVRLVNMDEDVVAPPLTEEWEEWLEDQRCERLGIKRKRKKGRKSEPKASKGGKGKGKGKAPADGPEAEVRTGGRGKGKGKRPALRPKPSGGKSIELVEEINAAARQGKRKRPAEPTMRISATPGGSTPATDTPASRESAPIFLRFQPPRVREIDSDGDSVRGYSSDEGSRSRSASASGQPTTNDFLARLASAVVPNLPYPLDGMEGMGPMEGLGVGQMDVEGFQALEMGVDLSMDGSNIPPINDHLPPIGPDHFPPDSDALEHRHMNGGLDRPLSGVQEMIQPEAAAAPSRLRLTLAPSATLGTSPATPQRRPRFAVPELSPPGVDPLPALYPAFSEVAAEPSRLRLTLAPSAAETSPATPQRRPRFAIPELSPPGVDPLPALYPAFPELGYPPYSPPAYSSHPMYSPYRFSPGPRDMERARERQENGSQENGNRQEAGTQESRDQAQPEPSPRKRRPPPPAAHIVRAPKHLKDQIDARMHQRA